jgi:hypothetical protein
MTRVILTTLNARSPQRCSRRGFHHRTTPSRTGLWRREKDLDEDFDRDVVDPILGAQRRMVAVDLTPPE